jgi:hypothetical protein
MRFSHYRLKLNVKQFFKSDGGIINQSWLNSLCKPCFAGANVNRDGRLHADLFVTVLKTADVGTHGKALVIER